MIIDIHTHCFPDTLAPRAVPALAKAGNTPAYTDGTITDLKKSMVLANIDISVLQPIATKPEQTPGVNRWAINVQDEHIVAFGTIHPDYVDWRDEIKQLTAANIRGVKFHPDYQKFYVDDPKLFPIYEALTENRMILLFHAGIDVGLPDPCHCTPPRLRKILDAFPDARIVAAHMGGYKCWDDVERYLVGQNIYFDTSFSLEELGYDNMQRIIRNHGTDRILFGTDSPWTDQATEVSLIKFLDLSRKDTNLILGENTRNLLRL